MALPGSLTIEISANNGNDMYKYRWCKIYKFIIKSDQIQKIISQKPSRIFSVFLNFGKILRISCFQMQFANNWQV
jgi:hypothetical protein